MTYLPMAMQYRERFSNSGILLEHDLFGPCFARRAGFKGGKTGFNPRIGPEGGLFPDRATKGKCRARAAI
jgi:hypothetical protein